MEPYPAGSEDGRSFGFELFLEGSEGAPLGGDLFQQWRFFASLRMTNTRFFATLRMTGGVILRSVSDEGSELGEIKVVVQDLAGVVKDGAGGCLGDNLC